MSDEACTEVPHGSWRSDGTAWPDTPTTPSCSLDVQDVQVTYHPSEWLWQYRSPRAGEAPPVL